MTSLAQSRRTLGSAMVPLGLLAALLGGCRPDPEALIVIAVTAMPAIPSVSGFRGVVTAGNVSQPFQTGLPQPTSLPPALRLPLYIPARLTGNVQIRLEAFDEGGLARGMGITTVATEPGRTTEGVITLAAPAEVDGGTGDLAVPDGGADDLAVTDGAAPDLTAPLDLAPAPADLAVPVDLLPPPDLTRVLAPSNVAPGRLLVDADDMPNNVRSIDTTNLVIKDQNFAPIQLTGKSAFVVDGNVAVLSVKSWTQSGALGVSGSRPLVVVASGPVTIKALIDCGAGWSGTTPYAGPGGGLPSAGPGNGGAGAPTNATTNSGGGGAGGGAPGGGGGDSSAGGKGGSAGPAYGNGFADLRGGSGGGSGGSAQSCGASNGGSGGAGGGALQIFSASSITLDGSGLIDASGAGGLGGCANRNAQPPLAAAGGGGGGGGMILLEAPSITLKKNSLLCANGGGGGGAADGTSFAAGAAGQRGMQDTRQALGGGGGSNDAGAGGKGGSSAGAAGSGGGGGVMGKNGGGGGGAAGRIYLRTSSSPASQMGSSSPPAVSDTTL